MSPEGHRSDSGSPYDASNASTSSWSYAPRPWRIGSAHLAALLESSLDLLQQLDIRVPPNGRHRTALRRLQAANDAAKHGTPLAQERLELLRHAHRTGWETAVIAVATFRAHRQRRGRNRASVPFSQQQLQTMMRGPEVYLHRPGVWWDTQFELMVAAQLVLGGLDVRSGEPDIRFRYGLEWVGMACKRLTSLRGPQMRHNISYAANQIQRAQRRGWIALNLDSSFRHVVVAGRRQDLLRRFNTTFDRINPIANDVSGQPEVLGVLAYAHLSEWKQMPHRRPQLTIRAPFRWVFWESPDPTATMFFRDFQNGWRSRVRQAMAEIMAGDLRLVL